MKTVKITCTWKSYHDIEVPDDWTVPSTLGGFPPEALDEMTPVLAELIDWE